MKLLRKLSCVLGEKTYKQARRIVIAVMGSTVLLLGVAMIILPGPAIVVIPAGLAILATEFQGAHRWLQRIKETVGVGKRPPQPGRTKQGCLAGSPTVRRQPGASPNPS
jgi:hypothetical protein